MFISESDILCQDDYTQVKDIYAIRETHIGELPIHYWVLLLITKHLSYADYLPLINKVVTRIHGQRGKLLFYVERLQLVIAVMISLSIQWVSSFSLPMRKIHEIKQVMEEFLQSRPECESSHALVGLEDVLFLYDKGDLLSEIFSLYPGQTYIKIYAISLVIRGSQGDYEEASDCK